MVDLCVKSTTLVYSYLIYPQLRIAKIWAGYSKRTHSFLHPDCNVGNINENLFLRYGVVFLNKRAAMPMNHAAK